MSTKHKQKQRTTPKNNIKHYRNITFKINYKIMRGLRNLSFLSPSYLFLFSFFSLSFPSFPFLFLPVSSFVFLFLPFPSFTSPPFLIITPPLSFPFLIITVLFYSWNKTLTFLLASIEVSSLLFRIFSTSSGVTSQRIKSFVLNFKEHPANIDFSCSVEIPLY